MPPCGVVVALTGWTGWVGRGWTGWGWTGCGWTGWDGAGPEAWGAVGAVIGVPQLVQNRAPSGRGAPQWVQNAISVSYLALGQCVRM